MTDSVWLLIAETLAVFALIFWGVLWGIVGMLLATPMTAVLKILFQRFDRTRVLADLLEGRLG